MKASRANIFLPATLRRSLVKLGSDLRAARQKRALTISMMLERTGVAKATYQKVEKGDPTVSLATYAMALYVLGFGDALGTLADAKGDETGLLLDQQRLPQRVRTKAGLQSQ
ncbi:MAG: family transcriptional regulator [Verrucomicrobia bacterium]|nr:family transcriptional regulator [Verrucomicrobiota bacterium]